MEVEKRIKRSVIFDQAGDGPMLKDVCWFDILFVAVRVYRFRKTRMSVLVTAALSMGPMNVMLIADLCRDSLTKRKTIDDNGVHLETDMPQISAHAN